MDSATATEPAADKNITPDNLPLPRLTAFFMSNSRILSVLLSACLAMGLSNCKTISSGRVVFPNAPVAYQTVSEMVDEETIDHTVKFRNVGNQVLSFDYTIADVPEVPHTDCLGPNSGLVENLYPGAEAVVKNPLKDRSVWVQLGRVTYGKKAGDQLAKIYKPETLIPAASGLGVGGAASPLPLLEPVSTTPGE